MKPDDDKLRELILYVAARCQSLRHFGMTKLNKILFYTDFTAYLERGRPVTGQRYLKLPYGPVAERVESLLNEMARGGEVEVEPVPVQMREEYRVRPLRDVTPGVLTDEDYSIADRFIERFKHQTGKQVSDISHDFVGWKVARMGWEIPYQVALLDMSPLTEDEERWVAQIAAEEAAR